MEQATIECEDFYNLCQAYRTEYFSDQLAVRRRYQSLIDYIDQRHADLLRQRDELRRACEALVAAFDGETDCTDILDMVNTDLRSALASTKEPK